MAGDRDSKPHGDRKRKFQSARIQHGSRNKKGDMGRGAWSRQRGDRRGRNDDDSNKRQKLDGDGNEEEGQSSRPKKPSVLPKPFPEDEVAAEERRPKHKVAVLIGYAGTGYRGMQINYEEKTIEGDLFTAFVAAGAISKANANDPKKSSLVRCARTDKGVHAAGNVISLKLIVEDEDIIKKINDNLTPQIRVWNITRTVGSFSSYQACDSRWYEYFIPTHSFLPPHPSSTMAKRLRERAEKAGNVEEFDARNKEVETFWEDTERNYIKPILDELPAHIRKPVEVALYESQVQDAAKVGREIDAEPDPEDEEENSFKRKPQKKQAQQEPVDSTEAETSADQNETSANELSLEDKKAVTAAVKKLKQAYNSAKRRWRIPPERLARIQPILDQFVGTHSFHYFTVDKTPTDPSALRVIKSFKVDPPAPILIGGEGKWKPNGDSSETGADEVSMNDETEWLSLRIHGQSFMMHQIRKMVSAIVLTIRCAADPSVSIPLTFSQRLPTKSNSVEGDTTAATDPTHIPMVTIPKAPGLGLLLLHPVFQNYNNRTAPQFGRDAITFETDEVKKKMDEFKYREIYERMFREEAEQGIFQSFWGHVDESSLGGWMWVGSFDKDKVEQYFPVQKESFKQRRKREEEEAQARENGANSSDDDLPAEEDSNDTPVVDTGTVERKAQSGQGEETAAEK